MECKKCNEKVVKCKDCNENFKSDDDVCCVKTDLFGDGKNVLYRHICKKCALEITGVPK